MIPATRCCWLRQHRPLQGSRVPGGRIREGASPRTRVIGCSWPEGRRRDSAGLGARCRAPGAGRSQRRRAPEYDYIPDSETELYFKAADVLALRTQDIFQSGVLFLGYSFGLPVVVTDVGSLRQDVVEGRTGFVCRPEDPHDLAASIARFFSSDLFRNLDALLFRYQTVRRGPTLLGNGGRDDPRGLREGIRRSRQCLSPRLS